MNDIDFPEIDTQPETAPAPTPMAAAVATQMNNSELVKVNLTDVALAHFGDWRTQVANATATLTGVQHDLSTPSKIEEAKSLRFRLIGQPRAEVRKVSKALKSKLAGVSKSVGIEEDVAVAAYDEAEKLITPQIEAREQQLADEKAERERIAAERAAAQAACLADIRGYVTRANVPGMTAARVDAGIALLASMSFPAEQWLDPVALANAQCETLETMRAVHAMLTEREAAAARVEAQRIENERLAAELAAQQRQLDEQQAELDRQAQEQRQRLEREAAEAERQRREAAEAEARQRAEDEAERNRLAELEARRLQEVTTAAKSMADAIAQPAAPTPEVSAAPAEPVKPAITVDLDTTPPPPPPAAEEPATLKLGTICERLGFSLTEAFIAGLGIERRGSDKRAVLYRESDWPAIKAALITKLQRMA